MVAEEIRLYADYRQFYVQDLKPNGQPDDPGFWTEATCNDRLALTDGIVAIGTASYGFVRVKVEVYSRYELQDTQPPVDLAVWDHVTEADLKTPSRHVLVFGCTATHGLFFLAESDHCRVRCCHANRAGGVDYGDGEDWYLVQIWPAKPEEPRVLKRWPHPV